MTSSFLLCRRFPGGFMITKEQIDRINQLARKAKTPEGLTDAENLFAAAGNVFVSYAE